MVKNTSYTLKRLKIIFAMLSTGRGRRITVSLFNPTEAHSLRDASKLGILIPYSYKSTPKLANFFSLSLVSRSSVAKARIADFMFLFPLEIKGK